MAAMNGFISCGLLEKAPLKLRQNYRRLQFLLKVLPKTYTCAPYRIEKYCPLSI